MTLSSAIHFGLASIFVLAASSDVAAYARAPQTPIIDFAPPVKTAREAKPTAPLDIACNNPGKMTDDGTTIFVKVDQSASVLAIPIAFAEENWDKEKRQYPLPENPERVLCPL